MTSILAHRGNAEGPSPETENGLLAIDAALRHGWGVEIDIRRAADGRFYISHDPRPSADGCSADAVCTLLRAYPDATVALNVKELGDEEALLSYLAAQRVLAGIFLFDMELIEPRAGETARAFKSMRPDVRLAARVSDRGESIDRALAIEAASVVWLDEFDRLWCTEQDVRRLKQAGRTVYAVSPDLHQFAPIETRQRWIDFCRWGVDGICTDYAAALTSVVELIGKLGAAA
jgi:glycerophosphoryl diester phosphodiesterase